jgi:hypothetical protein
MWRSAQDPTILGNRLVRAKLRTAQLPGSETVGLLPIIALQTCRFNQICNAVADLSSAHYDQRLLND